MAEFDEPRAKKPGLLLSLTLLAVPVVAGLAIINDTLQAGANASLPAEQPADAAAPEAPVVMKRMVDARELLETQHDVLLDATFAALPGEDAETAEAVDVAASAEAAEQARDARLILAGESGEDEMPAGLSAVRKVRTTAVKVVPTERGLSAVPDLPATDLPMAAPARAQAPFDAVGAFDDPEEETAALAYVTPAPPPQRLEVAALDVPQETPRAKDEAPKAEVADKPEAAGARVGRSAVNARSGPGRSSATLFVVDAGETVTAKGAHRGWVQIVDGDGREGWVYSDFLVGVKTSSLPELDRPAAAEVAKAEPAKAEAAAGGSSRAGGSFTPTEHVNVRAAPARSGGRLFVLAPGTEVKIKATSQGWTQIETPDGRSGWVYAEVK